jgi:hypothetical protein
MKPRTVNALSEITSEMPLRALRDAVRTSLKMAGLDVRQVSVSVAQPAKAKPKRKGKAKR